MLIPRTIDEHTFDCQALSLTISRNSATPIIRENHLYFSEDTARGVGTRLSLLGLGVVLHGEDGVAARVLERDEVAHLRDRETSHENRATGVNDTFLNGINVVDRKRALEPPGRDAFE